MADSNRLLRGGALACAALLAVAGPSHAADPTVAPTTTPAVTPPVAVVDAVPAETPTPLYPSNRGPLLTSPLVKLPIGAIKPGGWLLKQLQLEADGMAGHLPEVSQWCKFEGNAWTDPRPVAARTAGRRSPTGSRGTATSGTSWATSPGHRRGRAVARRHPRRPGRRRVVRPRRPAGRRTTRPSTSCRTCGRTCRCSTRSRAGYEYTAAPGTPDERATELMHRYFRWELNQPRRRLPPSATGPRPCGPATTWRASTGSTTAPASRGCSTWPTKIQRHTPAWMRRRSPRGTTSTSPRGSASRPSGTSKSERRARTSAGTDRGVRRWSWPATASSPAAGSAADETARPGYTDPRQGFETCGMVEYMHSFESAHHA